MHIKIADLEEIPPAMASRARWAREMILKQPELAEIDEDDLLAWVYHEEDQRWYSIAGNYSAKSPKEKMQDRREQAQKRQEYEETKAAKLAEQIAQQEFWSHVRQKVLDRDDYTCQICSKRGDSSLHIHHIMKRVEGGTDHYDNLLTVCPSCHKKADSTLYNPDWV